MENHWPGNHENKNRWSLLFWNLHWQARLPKSKNQYVIQSARVIDSTIENLCYLYLHIPIVDGLNSFSYISLSLDMRYMWSITSQQTNRCLSNKHHWLTSNQPITRIASQLNAGQSMPELPRSPSRLRPKGVANWAQCKYQLIWWMFSPSIGTR